MPIKLLANSDTEALNKALEAGYKQFKFEEKINILGQRTQYTVEHFIDQKTPFSGKSIFFVSAISWSILVDQKLEAQFTNPLYSRIENTLSLKRDLATLDFRLSF